MAALDDPEEARKVYVISFSEESDLLSQWRAYARPAGVAIGFPSIELSGMAAWNDMELAPCIYDPDEKRASVLQILETRLASVADSNYGKETNVSDIDIAKAVEGLLEKVATFKDSAFREEKEWRLIWRQGGDSAILGIDHAKKFVAQEHALLPKRVVPFQDTESKLINNIHTVVIGPGRNVAVTKETTEDLLRHHGYRFSEVSISKVPYRDL
ncbi:DUF2971 domain-containing protein [Inquilinus limosus]|uniref:DUF2971 domain-containing protein n=1 Tax=Inquilinus limosus TaxID=171674 RepID=UPI003F18339F